MRDYTAYYKRIQDQFLEYFDVQMSLGSKRSARELYAWWANLVVVQGGPNWDQIRKVRRNMEAQGIL